MGHNRAGVRAKKRLRRRIKEETRLTAKRQAAETEANKPGLLSRAAGAVGGFVKGVVQKVTGGGEAKESP